MTDNPTTLWIVVEGWPDGRSRPIEAWASEDKARYSAERKVTGDPPYYSLWTIPLMEPVQP